MSAKLCGMKRTFKPYQNEHDSVKESALKAKKHVTLTRKSFFTAHLLFVSSSPKILKAFTRNFPTKMKPTKYPGKENVKTAVSL